MRKSRYGARLSCGCGELAETMWQGKAPVCWECFNEFIEPKKVKRDSHKADGVTFNDDGSITLSFEWIKANADEVVNL